MLSLVPWLTSHDGVTIDDAARHFDVSPEQLEKDLWLLIVCGLPGYGPDQLVDIDFWDDGRIHVIDPQTLDRPLRLGADEATSLLLGLRLLEQVPGVRSSRHR
jgi:proteasome accessory factor C